MARFYYLGLIITLNLMSVSVSSEHGEPIMGIYICTLPFVKSQRTMLHIVNLWFLSSPMT